jgi:hypothetical protein
MGALLHLATAGCCRRGAGIVIVIVIVIVIGALRS